LHYGHLRKIFQKLLLRLIHLAHQQANYSLYAASGYFSLVEHQFSARLWRTA
jgi:hypothetical protein